MTLNPRQLDAFRATVRTGSTVAAARALNTSQPSISRMIADLEHAVGMALFSRKAGRLSLTNEGELFFSEVDHFFLGTDELMNRAREIREFQSVELRVATIAAAALEIVPVGIGELTRELPNLRSSVFQRSHFRTCELVGSGRVDLGVCNAVKEGSGISVELAVMPACRMALPVGHRLGERDVITADDLEGEAFISLGNEFYQRYLDDRDTLDRLAAATRSKCNLSLPLARMVAAGNGIGLIDPLTARLGDAIGVVTRPFAPEIAYPISVIAATSRPASRVSSGFLDLLVDRIGSIGKT